MILTASDFMHLKQQVYLIAFFIGCLLTVGCNRKEQKNKENQENITSKPENIVSHPEGIESNENSVEEKKAVHLGAAIYAQNCGTCHQLDGSGVSGLYPPLKSSDWVSGEKTRLINVVLKGLSRPIEVNGETYNNVMPQFSYLSDQQIADVLTYLRQNFGNNAGAILSEEVAEVRGSE